MLVHSSSLSRVFTISEEGLNGCQISLVSRTALPLTAWRDAGTRWHCQLTLLLLLGVFCVPTPRKTSWFKLQPYMAASLPCPQPRMVFCLDPVPASSFPSLPVTLVPNPLSHSVLDLIRSPALSRGWSSIANGSFL